jgi:hypothetical protein
MGVCLAVAFLVAAAADAPGQVAKPETNPAVAPAPAAPANGAASKLQKIKDAVEQQKTQREKTEKIKREKRIVPAPVPFFRPLGDAARRSKDESLAENVFLPADRRTLQKMADSRKLLAEGRFGEAVRGLGAILDEPEDFFFQPYKNSSIHRSLKAEAQRLIGQMPREGRELYELQYGARARRMLDEAAEAGDVTLLAEVSRRFFHTRSGYQATFLLGQHHFDHGRPLAGALTLQRLREAGEAAEELEPALSLTMAACWLQAGMTEKARESLMSLRQRHPTLRVAVGGREVPIFSGDAGAIDWLVGLIGPQIAADPAAADRWLMFRGDAARMRPRPAARRC